MNDQLGKQKIRDNWEKLEIFIRFFNGVVLSILTIIIGVGAQRVADSFKYGELTQKLLGDLALQDTSKVKRDLSLITLNRTIGDEKQKMLADMAEVICKSDSSTIKEKAVAFAILKERDSTRANYLEQNFISNRLASLSDRYLRKSSISEPNAIPADPNPIPKVSMAAFEKTNQSLGTSIITVFIQTNKYNKRLASIGKEFSKQNYLVPKIEIVNRAFRNSVRYFNQDDAATAADIAQTLLNENSKWKCEIQLLKNPLNKIPQGQIEIWIHD